MHQEDGSVSPCNLRQNAYGLLLNSMCPQRVLVCFFAVQTLAAQMDEVSVGRRLLAPAAAPTFDGRASQVPVVVVSTSNELRQAILDGEENILVVENLDLRDDLQLWGSTTLGSLPTTFTSLTVRLETKRKTRYSISTP